MLAKINFQIHSTLLSIFVKFIDVLFYVAAALVALQQQFGFLYLTSFYQIALLIAVLLLVPVFSFFGVYKPLRGRSLGAYFHTLLPALLALMVILAAIAFITKTGVFFSRAWFLYWHLYAVLSLFGFRILLWQALKLMRKHGFNHKRIVVIGWNDLTNELTKRVKNAAWVGFDIVAIFAHKNFSKEEKNSITSLVKRIPENLSQYIEEQNIDEVWMLNLSDKDDSLQEIIKSLRHSVVTIRYFPPVLGLDLFNHSVSEVLGLPVINIISSPMTGVNRIVKAIEDRILSFLILLLISPVFLSIALLVKLSSKGPVFYRQKRVGWNGKKFEMLKFRSMPVDAEVKTGAVWAKENDNRATKMGAFLRKTSLDELPQFINVLKGDMSIVGPRPERPFFVAEFKEKIPYYMQKHLVKAGITGWAQVNGWRGNTSLEKRIEYDLYYINHWSVWFDFKIILLTVFKGFVHKNAY